MVINILLAGLKVEHIEMSSGFFYFGSGRNFFFRQYSENVSWHLVWIITTNEGCESNECVLWMTFAETKTANNKHNRLIFLRSIGFIVFVQRQHCQSHIGIGSKPN